MRNVGLFFAADIANVMSFYYYYRYISLISIESRDMVFTTPEKVALKTHSLADVKFHRMTLSAGVFIHVLHGR